MDIKKNTTLGNIYEYQHSVDLSIVQFCRDNKMKISTLYAWRKRLTCQIKKVSHVELFCSLFMSSRSLHFQ